MKRVGHVWSSLRESLWFVPGVMLLLSLISAFALIQLDSVIARDTLPNYPRLFGLSAEGSRGMLTAIASSMLTVAALSFSLTLNAVAQASNLYSPRVIRGFLRDRANQFILGYFVSVFAYCLVVLRTIRGGDDDEIFIPSIAILTGLALALGGVVVLIFFIHHIAVSLQVTQIIGQIFSETRDAIDKMYPEKIGEPAKKEAPGEDALRDSEKREWTDVPSKTAGYVQNVDAGALEEFCISRGVLMRVKRSTGEFIAVETALASVTDKRPGSGPFKLSDDDLDRVNGMFAIGRHRTIEQDVGFGIQQLVDIALKALSTGINDTTTALSCIDRLGEIAGLMVKRGFPRPVRSLDGEIVVEVKAPGFEDYIENCFGQIRSNAGGKLEVFLRLIDAISPAIERADSEDRRRLLLKQLQLTEEHARRTLLFDHEIERFADHLAKSRRDRNTRDGR